MALIINGATVAAPKTFQVDLVDLDSENTQRNAKGVLMRDRLRQMRKLECEWGPLTNSQISTILTGVSSVNFSVEYPDPQSGGQQTRTFYVGDRTAPAYNFKNEIWQGLKLDLIEL